MSTLILASGSAAANSDDFTLTESKLVFLVPAGGGQVHTKTQVDIQAKSTTNEYVTVATLNAGNLGAGVLPAGTYRAVRHATGAVNAVEHS